MPQLVGNLVENPLHFGKSCWGLAFSPLLLEQLVAKCTKGVLRRGNGGQLPELLPVGGVFSLGESCSLFSGLLSGRLEAQEGV